MSKSKSKTFPKGTDYGDVADFVTNEIPTALVEGEAYAFDRIRTKVLITVTKYSENGKDRQ